MKKETIQMMDKILDSEMVGYAYINPRGGGNRQRFFISTTPENMANFLGSHMAGADKLTITDMCDRPILEAADGVITNSKSPDLRRKVNVCLAAIQKGTRQAGEVLEVSRREADLYFLAEDQAVTEAECRMIL